MFCFSMRSCVSFPTLPFGGIHKLLLQSRYSEHRTILFFTQSGFESATWFECSSRNDDLIKFNSRSSTYKLFEQINVKHFYYER
jgi:hypothetical protein